MGCGVFEVRCFRNFTLTYVVNDSKKILLTHKINRKPKGGYCRPMKVKTIDFFFLYFFSMYKVTCGIWYNYKKSGSKLWLHNQQIFIQANSSKKETSVGWFGFHAYSMQVWGGLSFCSWRIWFLYQTKLTLGRRFWKWYFSLVMITLTFYKIYIL